MITDEINGIKYYIKNQHDSIQKYLIHSKQWNQPIYLTLLDLIKKNNCSHFLNVGCHIGTIALPVSRHIKKVSAIEAFPRTYKHLCENIELNNIENIKTHNFAVGNSSEKIYFMCEGICPVEKIDRIKNNSGGMHVFTQSDIDNGVRSSALCDKSISNIMKPLDSMGKEIDDFDIMLVDIEGCEYDFLKGAKQKILKCKPIIIIEIWDDHKRKKEKMTTTRKDIIELIESYGYTLHGNSQDDFLFIG
jgi:FkbM family methyltransferase